MENNKRLPIILIPGMACSQLEARYMNENKDDEYLNNDWKILYLSFIDISNLDFVCEKLKMKPNEACTYVKNYDPDLLVRPYKFGSVDGIKYCDKTFQKYTYVFKYLIDFLVNSLGYEKNINIFGAPYDFRDISTNYVIKQYYSNLDNLIKLSYCVSETPCIIITYSMGSLLASEYLHIKSSEWKKKYIDSWISISGAFGGAVKSFKYLIYGLASDYSHLQINNELLVQTARTFPGLYSMLPNQEAFSEDDVIVKLCDKSYNCQQYTELFEVLGIEQYPCIRAMSYTFHNIYQTNVPSLFLYSKGIETTKTIEKCGDELNEITGDGDGTVNLQSLELCKKFMEHDALNTEIQVFSNIEHSKMLKNKSVFKALFDFIQRRNSLKNLETSAFRRCYSFSS